MLWFFSFDCLPKVFHLCVYQIIPWQYWTWCKSQAPRGFSMPDYIPGPYVFCIKARWPCDSGVSDYSCLFFLRVTLTTEAAATAGGKDKHSQLYGIENLLWLLSHILLSENFQQHNEFATSKNCPRHDHFLCLLHNFIFTEFNFFSVSRKH